MNNRIRITDLKDREIFNREGMKLVECDVCTIQGHFRAGVSFYKDISDKHKWKKERIRNEDRRKKVKCIISSFHPTLMGKHPDRQADIDKLLKNFDLGSSTEKMAIFAISMAICRAGAAAKQRTLRAHIRTLAKIEMVIGEKAKVLPIPVISLLHSSRALPFKEFDMIPVGAKSIAEALEIGSKVYAELINKILDRLNRSHVARHAVTGAVYVSRDFGMTEVKDVLTLLELVVKEMGFEKKVVFHVSVESNSMYDKRSKMYNIGKYDPDSHQEEKNSEKMLSRAEFLEFVLSLVKEFPMVRSLSNPLAKEDTSFKKITKELEGTCKIGFSSFYLQAFQKGCEEDEVNHAFISPRHTLIGENIYTVTDLISIIMSAKKQGKTITFEGSDLTETDFLTDLAVGLDVHVFKAGELDRYNQLLRIEEELGSKARVATLFQSQHQKKVIV